MYGMNKSNPDLLVPSVVSQEPQHHARDNSAEGKAAKAMIKGLDSLSFEPSKFIMPILSAPLVIRRRFLHMVYMLVACWSMHFDSNLYRTQEELDFLIEVKRMQDALLPFYGPND